MAVLRNKKGFTRKRDWVQFKQSQDRIHRIGQKNKCTYIILQARNTIDEKIYDCLQRKKNTVDELYNEIGLDINNPK